MSSIRAGLANIFLFCCSLITLCDCSWATTLIGSSATGSLYFPNLATLYIPPASGVPATKTATVNDAVEFPAGTLIGDTLFTIDISSNQLVYQPNVTVTYDSAVSQGARAFNGFVFSFAGAPEILGVAVNSASNFSPVSLLFTSNSVTFDLRGLSVNSASKLVIDFSLADAVDVPLPASLPFFAAGLAGMGLFGRRRTKRAKAANDSA